MKENNSSFSAYSKLIKKAEKISNSLTGKHRKHMQCRLGCASCCMNYSIMPLEFYYIQGQLQKEGFNKSTIKNKEVSEECIFLSNGACSIYNHRPMICRTHGLPLLYTNDDFEWELSTCELNFREYNYEEFYPENTFPQDKFNSMLFMLNKKFITEFREKGYDEFTRIPIHKLANNL